MVVAGSGVLAFVDSPSASVGDPAQGFDVDMYQLTRAITHIPDRNPRRAVQGRQTRQPPAGRHRVDRRPGHSEASGHQMRAFPFGETVGRYPVLGFVRQAGGAAPRTGRPVLETGFAFGLEAAQPPVHSLAGHPLLLPPPEPGSSPPSGPGLPAAGVRTVSTGFYYSAPRGLLGIADAFHPRLNQAGPHQPSIFFPPGAEKRVHPRMNPPPKLSNHVHGKYISAVDDSAGGAAPGKPKGVKNVRG